jgi:predicted RNase H-like HicB family nuclease
VNKSQLLQSTYHANFELDQSGVWLAEIEEIPHVHTYGRTLGKARQYVVDALALWLNEPIESLKDRIEYRPPALDSTLLTKVHEAQALTADAKLSLRDAAELLGISHQRVQQLVVLRNGSAVAAGGGRIGIAQDVARSLKEFLPGGEKEELGAIAAGVALGLAIAWTQTHD